MDRALPARSGGLRRQLSLWIGPPSRPRAIANLREQGMESAAIQARIGELYGAQLRALEQRAQAYRHRAEYDPQNS